MNTSNLKKDMVVKNYRELCELLNEPIKLGTSKTSQMKDFERYFKYKREGHKFLITEIYSLIKPKNDGRVNGKNSIYNELAQILIIEKLASTEGDFVSISKSKLLKDISLTNENYSACKKSLLNLANYLDMDVNYVYDFYNNNDTSFTGIINRALKTLQDKRTINYSTGYKVRLRNDKIHRRATDSEIGLITKCEKEALTELGFHNVSDVRSSGKWKTYHNLALSKIKELSDIFYYYQAYNIFVNRDYLESDYLYLINDLEKKHAEMNNLVINQFEKKVIHRIELNKGKSNIKSSEDYYNNNIKLSKVLLDKSHKSILTEVNNRKAEDITQLDLDEFLPF